MQYRADPQAVAELDALVELHIGEEVLCMRSSSAGAELRLGLAPERPDLTITCDVMTFGAIALGRLLPAAALRERRLAIEGDRKLLARFFSVYRLPPIATKAA